MIRQEKVLERDNTDRKMMHLIIFNNAHPQIKGGCQAPRAQNNTLISSLL